jgi:hypothetical protein
MATPTTARLAFGRFMLTTTPVTGLALATVLWSLKRSSINLISGKSFTTAKNAAKKKPSKLSQKTPKKPFKKSLKKASRSDKVKLIQAPSGDHWGRPYNPLFNQKSAFEVTRNTPNQKILSPSKNLRTTA